MNQFKLLLILLFISSMLVNCSIHKTGGGSYCNLKVEDFQKTIDGKQTSLYFLQNGDLSAAITNYGGRIVSLCVPGRNGEVADVVLGFKSIDDSLNAKAPFYRAIIGRVCNRIAKGKFVLDGLEYSLPINNGVNHLHGGPDGFYNIVWDVKSTTDSSIVLTYLSKEGEMGYPGNLNVKVKYTLTSTNEVKIHYQATTDKATPVNLTNHAFYNLADEGNGAINNQWLTINANFYTPLDSTTIPLGTIEPVEGTPFDFRKSKPIGRDLRLQNVNKQLKNANVDKVKKIVFQEECNLKRFRFKTNLCDFKKK